MSKLSFMDSRYPVTLQCTYHGTTDSEAFCRLLRLLSAYGFYGIELNLPVLEAVSASNLVRLLNSYELRLTYVATGAYAKKHHYSLSSPDRTLRQASIEGCKENIRFASECNSGIIIGFLKNNPITDSETPDFYLEDSLHTLESFAQSRQVPILLEATNRYESHVANTIQDTVQILNQVGSTMISVLPDTFHMNIEESDPLGSVERYHDCYQNFHFSDNNRLFPGMGYLQFEPYIKKLDSLRYQGTIGIEGNLKSGYEEDLAVTVGYLSKLLR